MPETEFNPAILSQFREAYFPALVQRLTSGYNVYRNKPKCTAPYLVSYLHSDLGYLPDGSPHPHRQELVHKLEKYGPSSIFERLAESIVDRMAIYKLGEWEENPPGLVYYDSTGNILDKESLMDYEGAFIVEGRQYDLGIEAVTRKDLDRVIGVLNKYTYMHLRGKRGDMLGLENPHAITGAWKIPLITITTQFRSPISGFDAVSEVSTTVDDHEAYSLVRSHGPLTQYLHATGLPCSFAAKRVSRPFVRNYLEGT